MEEKLTATIDEVTTRLCEFDKLLDEMPNQHIADILRSWGNDLRECLK